MLKCLGRGECRQCVTHLHDNYHDQAFRPPSKKAAGTYYSSPKGQHNQAPLGDELNPIELDETPITIPCQGCRLLVPLEDYLGAHVCLKSRLPSSPSPDMESPSPFKWRRHRGNRPENVLVEDSQASPESPPNGQRAWENEGLLALSSAEIELAGSLPLKKMPCLSAPTPRAHVLGVQTLFVSRAEEFYSLTLKYPTDGMLVVLSNTLAHWELNPVSAVNFTRMEAFITTLTSTCWSNETLDGPTALTLMDIIRTYDQYGKHLISYLITPERTETSLTATSLAQKRTRATLLDKKLGNLCTLSNAQRTFYRLSLKLTHELQSLATQTSNSGWQIARKRSGSASLRPGSSRPERESTGRTTRRPEYGPSEACRRGRQLLDASPVTGSTRPNKNDWTDCSLLDEWSEDDLDL